MAVAVSWNAVSPREPASGKPTEWITRALEFRTRVAGPRIPLLWILFFARCDLRIQIRFVPGRFLHPRTVWFGSCVNWPYRISGRNIAYVVFLISYIIIFLYIILIYIIIYIYLYIYFLYYLYIFLFIYIFEFYNILNILKFHVYSFLSKTYRKELLEVFRISIECRTKFNYLCAVTLIPILI